MRPLPACLALIGLLCQAPRPAASAEPGWHLAESLAFSPAPSRADVSSKGFSLTLAADRRSAAGWTFGAAAGATLATLASPSVGASTTLDPSNISLTGGHRLATSAFDLGIGLHLAAPLALYWRDNIQGKRATEHNYLTASTARGQRDAWLWQSNTFPAGLALDLDLRFSDRLHLLARAEPTALLSLNSRPARLALLSVLELRTSWRPVGVRLGWSHLASTLALENLDHDQHAAWLGLDLLLGERQVGLTTTVNLDGPWGVSTGEAKPTWGLALNARHKL